MIEDSPTGVQAAADSATRVFNVEVTVPNGDGSLKPGMVASLAVARGGAPEAVAALALASLMVG